MTLPTPWRTVRCLLVMRDQADRLWPGRSKASDGTVADAAHSTTSDHYPHHVDALGANYVVTALDLTHDPAHGADMVAATEALRRSRDPRLKYVIFNREIFSNPAYSHAAEQWAWRGYTGSDPHTNHAHVSVLDAVIADSMTPWQLSTRDTGGASSMEISTGIEIPNYDDDSRVPAVEHTTVGTALGVASQRSYLGYANTKVILEKLAEFGAGGVRPEDVAEHIITDERFKAVLTEAMEAAIARVRVVVDPAI